MMENYILNSLNNLNKKFYSVELCSTKHIPFDSLSSLDPLFYSITWHQTHSKKQIENPALIIAADLVKQGKNVLLHLPCRYFSKENVYDILSWAKIHNVKNIFALQGDPVEDTVESKDFNHAVDLVYFIKKEFGNYFNICVAGYPLCHHKAANLTVDLFNLKQKVDAGADFIITQMIFEIKTFHEFYKSCRAIGINIPIIPGVHIINSFDSLEKLTNICRVHLPKKILNDIDSIKNNSLSLENYGLHQAADLINTLLTDKDYPVNNIHIFSLNDIDSLILLLHNETDLLHT